MADIDSKTQQRNLPTFLNMSLLVTNLVLEKMEPMDLLRARKVCRSLRSAVDKFGLRFGYIYLLLMKNEVKMKLSVTEIKYTSTENGSSNVAHNEQKKIVAEENFMERAAKDFKIVANHARNIEIRNCTEDRHDIVTIFIEILKSEKCIQVEEIQLWSFSFDEVLTILPCFNSKLLKVIKLRWMKSIDQFERITHLEQWKNAEEFKIIGHRIDSTMIVHLFHFKFFDIYKLDDLSVQTAIQIRDDLLRRSTFQSCIIVVDEPDLDPIEIAKVFKPDYAGKKEFNFEYLNGNDKFNISYKYQGNEDSLNVKRL